MDGTKIKSFTDLIAWQKAHRVAIMTYKITKEFPHSELYGLVSQMRRAAISVTSNIAEGFSRQSAKEKIQFYHMALGSDTELQNQLLLANDLNYIEAGVFTEAMNSLIEVNKLVNGLIKSLRKK